MRQYITSSVPLALADAARIDAVPSLGFTYGLCSIIKPGLGALGILRSV